MGSNLLVFIFLIQATLLPLLKFFFAFLLSEFGSFVFNIFEVIFIVIIIYLSKSFVFIYRWQVYFQSVLKLLVFVGFVQFTICPFLKALLGFGYGL